MRIFSKISKSFHHLPLLLLISPGSAGCLISINNSFQTRPSKYNEGQISVYSAGLISDQTSPQPLTADLCQLCSKARSQPRCFFFHLASYHWTPAAGGAGGAGGIMGVGEAGKCVCAGRGGGSCTTQWLYWAQLRTIDLPVTASFAEATEENAEEEE